MSLVSLGVPTNWNKGQWFFCQTMQGLPIISEKLLYFPRDFALSIITSE
jgi:hypothetical protein